tara:strand:- start:269 stop:841 length:573 start_codon:yes stop_codon:yes gene_type:complete
MGLKRTQGQKRNCKKGTRKQQNKRTGKRKTAKKNLRRKRQTKRRLKGGASVLGIRKEREAENGPTNAEEPKHKAENGPNLEKEMKGYSPAVKRGKKDKNNYLNPENDKNNYLNPDYTRGEGQFNYHEVENEVYYLDAVNSGAYNQEERDKLKELYENRMTRKNWKEEFEDYIDERREEEEEEEKGSAGQM